DVNDKNNPVEVLKRCLEANRETHILITITKLSGEWRNVREGEVIRYTNALSLNVLGNDLIVLGLNNAVSEQISIGHSGPCYLGVEDGRGLGCFIEILPPEISIILMGHQYDVYPLSRLVKEIGWRLTIV